MPNSWSSKLRVENPDTQGRDLGETAALALLPDNGRCKELGPEDLVLALRNHKMSGAIATLVEATTPISSEGPRLDACPLPPEVRQPVEQMVAELRAW